MLTINKVYMSIFLKIENLCAMKGVIGKKNNR
jgi:hypothetical protein